MEVAHQEYPDMQWSRWRQWNFHNLTFKRFEKGEGASRQVELMVEEVDSEGCASASRIANYGRRRLNIPEIPGPEPHQNTGAHEEHPDPGHQQANDTSNEAVDSEAPFVPLQINQLAHISSVTC